VTEYKKLIQTIKKSLNGVLPCYLVGRIAVRVADALVAEGISFREDEGK